MENIAEKRRLMVERQIANRGIRDGRVLEAMNRVPREDFVPEPLSEFAYDDAPLPIEQEQTISQPYIVALMAAAAEIKPDDHVLEIGTGSGYAAAILSAMGARVFTIERHQALAETARHRLQRLGYGQVEVHHGDGTLGLPKAAPFDAILAAAGGPAIPQTWRDQLAIGGRIVMPVGRDLHHQQLIKLTRTGKSEFVEEDLGAVSFVPLIGAHGWSAAGSEEGEPTPGHGADEAKAGKSGASRPSNIVAGLIADAAEPLPEFWHPDFANAFERFADKRIVLLGEASHGTAEFYRARALITQRLIEKHGFSIVAVEADWPDAAAVDRYVRHRPAPASSEPPFRRFPTWMWRNTEVEAFTEWLRAHNEKLPPAQRAGFYGLDMYNLSGSIAAVLGYLDRVDPEAARVARERYGCLTPWQKDPAVYGRAVLSHQYHKCEEEVVAQLRDLLEKQFDYTRQDGAQFLDAAQNARLVAAAERYYRIMYYGSAQSWNLRDTHMFETLSNLLDAQGPQAKAVVWAHNSHIGNAAATDMGRVRDEVNIGQLCRERFGDEAALIGFGTYTGTVAAATDWDGPMEIKRVKPARGDSYEYLAHQSG
ncbi:MAG TPA: protein-L-isoaspartate(D-aspartate) O-methyltransferase, partial [Methylophilaceae bacterium]|nr:protein-L-isoaspartate(D-aspartate) O-methyltransferase [Methylophilaceae bacterium]